MGPWLLHLLTFTAVCVRVSSTKDKSKYTATCAPGSPVVDEPFCDPARPVSARALLLAQAATTEEKLTIWNGHGLQQGISRLNVHPYRRDTVCFQGAALNTRDVLWTAPNVTVFPNAINVGATFDVELAAQAANATAAELRGVNELQLQAGGFNAGPICDVGPMANTAHDPRWGRIAQVYGEDPYLCGSMTATTVQNLQNRKTVGDREYLQIAVTVGLYIGAHGDNSGQVPKDRDAFELTARDLHDQYLPSYEAGLMGPLQADGVMCGHAAFNATPCCASQLLLDTVLRDEWNSSAMVRTDCCHDISNMVDNHHFTSSLEDAVVAAVDAGLQYCFGCDMGDETATVDALSSALATGRVSTTQFDNAIARGLLTRFNLGEFDRDPASSPYGSGYANTVDAPAHRQLARQLAAASIVLVENHGTLLPLGKGHAQGHAQRHAAAATPTVASSMTVAAVGPFADCKGQGQKGWTSENCYLQQYVGVPSKVVSVAEGIAKATVATLVPSAAEADVIVVAVGLGPQYEAEGRDRSTLKLPGDQQALIDSTARSLGPKQDCVVLLFTAGPVDFDRAACRAVVWAGYPGEEAGNAVADVLFGSVSPSGRLPMTWYRNEYLSHVGNLTDYDTTSGVGRTYRYLIPSAAGLVAYPFGHGLSFANFSYKSLRVTKPHSAGSLMATVEVANTGNVAAHEVVQVYVVLPADNTTAGAFPRPALSLCGFAKKWIEAGDTVEVAIPVPVKLLGLVWPNGTRIVPTTGTFDFYAGGNQPFVKNGAPVVSFQLPA